MNRTSCIVNIQSKMKVLTGSEKKVAEYVLKNYMRVLDFTVTELAEKAGVSDATVVRFCRQRWIQRVSGHENQPGAGCYCSLQTFE